MEENNNLPKEESQDEELNKDMGDGGDDSHHAHGVGEDKGMDGQNEDKDPDHDKKDDKGEDDGDINIGDDKKDEGQVDLSKEEPWKSGGDEKKQDGKEEHGGNKEQDTKEGNKSEDETPKMEDKTTEGNKIEEDAIELNELFKEELEKKEFVHKKEDSDFAQQYPLPEKPTGMQPKLQTVAIDTVKKPLILFNLLKNMIVPKKEGNTMAGFKDRVKGFLKVLFVLSIILTEIIVIYLAYQVYQLYRNPVISQHYNVKYKDPGDADTDELKGGIDLILNRPDQINGFQILKRDGITSKTLITLSKYEKEQIVRYGDNLFYPKDGLIYVMDVNTLEEKPIFDINSYYSGETNVFVSPKLFDIKVLGDTVYASYGGYALNPGTYWIDPTTFVSGKLTASRNAEIMKYGEDHWLVGGEADGGVVIQDLIFFDAVNRSVVKDFEFESYFNVGEYLLELNEEEKYFILVGSKEQEFSGVSESPVPAVVYDYLKLFPSPLYDEEVLMDFAGTIETPVLEVGYDKDSKTVYFSTDTSLYKYDIAAKSYEKTLDYPQQITSPVFTVTPDELCVKDRSNDKEFLINVLDKTAEEVFFCDLSETTVSVEAGKEVEFSDTFGSLGLPEDFYFEVLQ